MSATKSSPHVEPDLLSRTNFVQHCHDVLEVLDVSSGAVLGLQGHWGSGKTWVLQALKQRLSDAPSGHDTHWVWIDVNPWMFSGSNQVVEQVLDEIGKQFLGGQVAAQVKKLKGAAKTAQGIGEQVLKFRSLLGKARGHIDWVEAVSPQVAALIKLVAPAEDKDDDPKGNKPEPKGDTQPDRQSLHDLKEALTKKLQGVNFKVVIAYDDMDRMPPVEVCEVIQAIKAVANFPNVVHLMAYDEAVVAKALEKHLKIDNGQAYLEKIVSYEVVVPAPLEHLFWQALRSKVQAVMEQEQKGASPTACQDLGEQDWLTALSLTADLMQSPRDVQRLLVRFQLALRKLGDTVDLKDLLLIEALALKQPALIKEIGRKRNEWMKVVDMAQVNQTPQVPPGLNADVHRALAFIFSRLTEPRMSRQRGHHGLDDEINWLGWWQWQPDADGVSPVTFLASFEDESTFRQSRWLDRVEAALLILDTKYGDDLHQSKTKALQVMAHALLKEGRSEPLDWVLGRMPSRLEFFLGAIERVADDERPLVWRMAIDLLQPDDVRPWLERTQEIHGISDEHRRQARQRFFDSTKAALNDDRLNSIYSIRTVRQAMLMLEPGGMNAWLTDVLGAQPEEERLSLFILIATKLQEEHPELLEALKRLQSLDASGC